MMIRKEKESQVAILMRILTNYLQIIAITLSFNIKFPGFTTKLFMPANKIGQSSEVFLSFDCFFQDTNITLFAPSTVLLKIFLTALIPFVCLAITALVWTLLYTTFRKRFRNIKRNIIVSMVVILFLLHPILTKKSFELFQCVEIDENESRVVIDLKMKCYSSEHILWSFLLGIPMLIFWGLGIPLTAFIILWYNRYNLDSSKIRKYYLMIYQGLKRKVFFWEFVNTTKKMLILSKYIYYHI
jgi:glycosyltransferase involved in cell wall biosynthesis